jgi:beta-lactamase class A
MDRGLAAELETMLTGFPGRVCLAACDLQSGKRVQLRAGEQCPTASVIKLPILVHALLCVEEGTLSLNQPVPLRAEDITPGSGILNNLQPGITLTLLDTLRLMTVLSDNTATNQVIDLVGIEPVNTRMQQLGLSRTRLNRRAYAPNDPACAWSRRFGLGVSTAGDQMRLLQMLHRRQVGNEETSCLALEILSRQQYRNGIPRCLPSGVGFAGKSGAVDHVRNDVGIVHLPNGRDVAVAVFCSRIPFVLWTEENPGLKAIGAAARLIVQRWHPDINLPQPGWEPNL